MGTSSIARPGPARSWSGRCTPAWARPPA